MRRTFFTIISVKKNDRYTAYKYFMTFTLKSVLTRNTKHATRNSILKLKP